MRSVKCCYNCVYYTRARKGKNRNSSVCQINLRRIVMRAQRSGRKPTPEELSTAITHLTWKCQNHKLDMRETRRRYNITATYAIKKARKALASDDWTLLNGDLDE